MVFVVKRVPPKLFNWVREHWETMDQHVCVGRWMWSVRESKIKERTRYSQGNGRLELVHKQFLTSFAVVFIEENTLSNDNDNNLQANIELDYQFHDRVRHGQYDLEEEEVNVCRQNGISGHPGVAWIHVRAGTIHDHLMRSIRNIYWLTSLQTQIKSLMNSLKLPLQSTMRSYDLPQANVYAPVSTTS